MKSWLAVNAAAFLAAVVALAPGAAWAAPRRKWDIGQSVRTTSGTVHGQGAEGAPTVSEYLGIPYAKPPVGSLRFQPPQKYCSNDDFNATKFGFSCMQALSSPFTDKQASTVGMPDSANLVYEMFGRYPGTAGPMSEDCLTLNVWTKPQTGETKKPVFFWIYGGSYTTGGSDFPAYNGKFIADDGEVVVVSINYRVNVFGFPGNPQSSSNLGLQDVRLAMEWVRNNIEYFGGDKQRITMAGQSAGAGLVDYYAYAYVKDPIANGFILESGVSQGSSAPINTSTARTSWLGIAGKVGCPNDTVSDATFQCMVGKNATDLVGGLGGGLSFVPVSDNGLVYTTYVNRSSAEGGYIIGMNNNEAGLLYMYYPNTTLDEWAQWNEDTFNCPAAERARRSLVGGHPTWRYRYYGDFPNMVITTKPWSGSYHGIEQPVYFNTAPTGDVVNTPEELNIGKYMRGAFAAFAKDTKAGLLSYGGNGGWPLYDPKANTLARLAYQNKTGTNLARGNMYDSKCQLDG